MDHESVTNRRILLYVLCLFLLSLGASFSIQANLGVSPVVSLAYGVSLTSGLSIGITTVIANSIYIILQVILHKRFELKRFCLQLTISFLFGLFNDITLFVLQLFPTPETLFVRWIYLIFSLFVIAAGLLGYITVKLPFMPYDALIYAIIERFHQPFGRAKIICDFINVSIGGIICLLFIQSFGSIGVGTLISAYFTGKILEWMMIYYQKNLQNWSQTTVQ
ncbi:putative membrane protein YczE [Neobacillus niacini]|uniref:YczE/YyaS/YitT family protein n=1 Tax=Neobacillus niacini TaxID=86668 RepID=UPI00285D6F3D|nr:DUF6198 family protein [Neobacillus niacini]MDR7080203.1 putative membrane protein YczE [Neobacillus niacini]